MQYHTPNFDVIFHRHKKVWLTSGVASQCLNYMSVVTNRDILICLDIKFSYKNEEIIMKSVENLLF